MFLVQVTMDKFPSSYKSLCKSISKISPLQGGTDLGIGYNLGEMNNLFITGKITGSLKGLLRESNAISPVLHFMTPKKF